MGMGWDHDIFCCLVVTGTMEFSWLIYGYNPWLITVNNWNNNISGWWFGTCFMFPSTGNFIIPTDELTPSFFRG